MNDISVILNVYNRPENLEEQIKSILDQSVEIKPENIHIWYNKSDKKQSLPINDKINTYGCNWNTKFFGRFTVPLLCKTKYIAMFDDDIYPQKNWFKNCLESMDKQEGIYGGSGVTLKQKDYRSGYKTGWNGIRSGNINRVDLVGHAWFFKQEWSKYLWYEKLPSWDNGEDIMFSYLAQKYGSINTYVPPHPNSDLSLWSTDFNYSMKHGNDENASFKKNDHYYLRNQICIHAVNNGWNTVNRVK